MTEFQSDEREGIDSPQSPGRSWTAVGVVVSLFISGTLMIWSFSLPFQRGSTSDGPVTEQKDFFAAIRQRKTEAKEIREAAVNQHRDFLFSLQKQKLAKLQQRVPGQEEVQKKWKQKTDVMKAQIAELTATINQRNATEGSFFWQRREQLMKVVADSKEPLTGTHIAAGL